MSFITGILLGGLILTSGVVSDDELTIPREQMLLGVAKAIDYRLDAMLELYSKNETEEVVVQALWDMGPIVWDFDNMGRRANCTEAMKNVLDKYDSFCGNYVYVAHQTKIPIVGLGISKAAIVKHLLNWHTENWDSLKQERKNRYIIELFNGKMNIEEETTSAPTVPTTLATTAILTEVYEVQNATLVDEIPMAVITNSSDILP